MTPQEEPANAATPVRRDSRPLYAQVQEVILSDISSGMHEGSKLPTEDEWASLLGVSRTTIRTALANLETSGFIRRVHGEGTFIAKKPVVVKNPLDSIKSFYPHMTGRTGLPAGVTNLTIESVAADESLASRSGLPIGTLFTKVARVVEVDQTPVAYFVDSIPASTATVEEMRDGFQDNVMDYLWNQGVDVAWYRMKVIAVRAQSPLDSLLKVTPGSILFMLDGEFVTEDGEFVNTSAAYFVPESVELTLWRKVEHGERSEPARSLEVQDKPE